MPKKVLIIEDEENLLEIYKMKFVEAGYDVITASDGREGLNSAINNRPDIVLLDILMPEINGIQVLKKIRKANQTKNLKIFIISNLVQNDEIKEAMSQGADGYFIKANLTPSQLVDKVNNIFKQNK